MAIQVLPVKPVSRPPKPTGTRAVPWLWLAPALFFLIIFLVYPVFDTLRLSFMNANSTSFVGLDNYEFAFTSTVAVHAILDSLLWVVLFTFLCVGLGLVFAVLTGRVRYEAAAKSIIFIPMAISFVAAAVIWRFVYAYRPPGFEQIGIANAITQGLGFNPIPWLQQQAVAGVTLPSPLHLNNFAVIFVGVWMWTGFAMVIISAGLKGISTEVLEAARVDGANEWQVFRRIIFPMLGPTLAVVATTLVIQALKNFDIVWVMTSGNYDTEVIATLMYKQMFNFQNFGRASAVAIVLLITILPVMLINIRRFRFQEEIR